MVKILKLKNDKYRRSRGGYARVLSISCEGCKKLLALYQKDGPGDLKRMYLDRIITPEVIFLKSKAFVCKFCKREIGMFYIYKKEKRPAIRLYQGSVLKKIAQR